MKRLARIEEKLDRIESKLFEHEEGLSNEEQELSKEGAEQSQAPQIGARSPQPMPWQRPAYPPGFYPAIPQQRFNQAPWMQRNTFTQSPFYPYRNRNTEEQELRVPQPPAPYTPSLSNPTEPELPKEETNSLDIGKLMNLLNDPLVKSMFSMFSKKLGGRKGAKG